MSKVLIPDSYYGLGQATLRVARHQSPTLWSDEGLPTEEGAIYAGLDEAYQPVDLAVAFSDRAGEQELLEAGFHVPAQRVEAVRRATASDGGRLRFTAFQRAQRDLRRALHNAKVPFALQSVRTGRQIEASPEIWGSSRAPYWFQMGRVPALTGGSERVPVQNAERWGLRGENTFYDVPNGDLFVVLIPKGSLAEFLDGAAHAAPPSWPCGDAQIEDFRLSLDQALIWIATRDPDLVNEASARLALGSRRGTWLGPATQVRRRTWMLTRVEATLLDRGDPTPFTMSATDAEEALWRALCSGELRADLDGETNPAWWFADALLQNRGDPDRMVFARHRDRPIVLATSPDGSALANSRQELEPRFATADVLALFPSIAANGGNDEAAGLDRAEKPSQAEATVVSGSGAGWGRAPLIMHATLEAMRAIWPPSGVPPRHLSTSMQERRISEHLKEIGLGSGLITSS